MGAKIGVLLNCGQQSQFSKVRREFDAGRVNLDPPMTCADWPVPGNLTLLHTQTAYTRKPWHRYCASSPDSCPHSGGHWYCPSISSRSPYPLHVQPSPSLCYKLIPLILSCPYHVDLFLYTFFWYITKFRCLKYFVPYTVHLCEYTRPKWVMHMITVITVTTMVSVCRYIETGGIMNITEGSFTKFDLQ